MRIFLHLLQNNIPSIVSRCIEMSASSHHDHHKTLGGGEHPSPSGKSRRLSRCKRNTPHGSICYNGLCGTQQSIMPSYFIKMLDVEFILTVDDIEYQHQLLSRPKSVTQHTTSVQLIKVHRHLQVVHGQRGRYQDSRISKTVVHARHLTFAIDNDTLIATFSEGRDPWRD